MKTKIRQGFKLKVVSDNIVRLTGPSACGKSTVGKIFAASFGMPVLQIDRCDAVGLNRQLHLQDNPRTVFLDGYFKKSDIKKLMPVMLDWAKEDFVFIFVQYPSKPKP